MTLNVTTFDTSLTKTTFKAESRLKSVTLNERPVEDNSLEEGFLSDIRLEELKNSKTATQNDSLQNITNLDRAFYRCVNLVNIPEISSNCTSMKETFYDCIAFNDEVTIPSEVTNLDDCFNGCKNLTTTPTINSTQVHSLLRTFKNSGLTQGPRIPSSVTSMVDTFFGCTSLSTMEDIPSTVINMERAFYNCTSLTELSFSRNSSLTNMRQTFYNCTSLQGTISIPSNVTNLYETFYNCYSLSKINSIPSNVISLERTFYNCTNLDSLEHDISSNSNVENMKQSFYNCTNLKRFGTFPNNVTDLFEAFYKCKSLSQIGTIPDTVLDMERTFYGCSNLENVSTIPSNVQFLKETFYNCPKLKGVIDIESKNVYDATDCFYTSEAIPSDRNVYIPMYDQYGRSTTLTYDSFIKAGYSDQKRKHGVLLARSGHRIVTFTIISSEKPITNPELATVGVKIPTTSGSRIVIAKNTMETHEDGKCTSGCAKNKFYVQVPQNTDFKYSVQLERYNSVILAPDSLGVDEKNITVDLTFKVKTFTLKLGNQNEYDTSSPTTVSIYVNNRKITLENDKITRVGGSVSFTYFIEETASVKYECTHPSYNTVVGYEEWDTNSDKTVQFTFERKPYPGDPKIYESNKGGQVANITLPFGYKYKITCVGGGGGSSYGAGGAGSALIVEIELHDNISVTATTGSGGKGGGAYCRNNDGEEGTSSTMIFGDNSRIESFSGTGGNCSRVRNNSHPGTYYSKSITPRCNVNFRKNVIFANPIEIRRASWIEGTNYGEGANGGYNGTGTGERGRDGYIKIEYIGVI